MHSTPCLGNSGGSAVLTQPLDLCSEMAVVSHCWKDMQRLGFSHGLLCQHSVNLIELLILFLQSVPLRTSCKPLHYDVDLERYSLTARKDFLNALI